MGSISDKLSYLEETKQEIADAIVEKGQTVQDSDTFRSYADKIKEISGGGSGGSMQRTVIWEGTVSNVGDSGICSQSIEDFDFLLAYGIPLDVQTETHLQWLSVNDIKKNYGVANFSYEYYDTIYIRCAFIDNKTFQCLQATSMGSSHFAYTKIEGIKFQSGSGGGSSITTENIYSTEEQIIGTWLDGKPIYRKAYYVNKSFPSNSDADFTSYIPNFSEMDTFVKAFGYKPSNKGFINLHGYINSNKLMLHTDWGLGLVEGNPNILILEYTKTTN